MMLENSQVISVYKALSDEIRLGIVQKVASSKTPVLGCDIVSSCATLLEMSQPTLSHHFTKLVAAGVLEEQKIGTQKYYHLNRAVLKQAGIDINTLKRIHIRRK